MSSKIQWLTNSTTTYVNADESDSQSLYNLVRNSLPAGWEFDPNFSWQNDVTYFNASGNGVGSSSLANWPEGDIPKAPNADDASVVIIGTSLVDMVWIAPIANKGYMYNGNTFGRTVSDMVAYYIQRAAFYQRQGKYVIFHFPYSLPVEAAPILTGGVFSAIDPVEVTDTEMTTLSNGLMMTFIAEITPFAKAQYIPMIDDFTACRTGVIDLDPWVDAENTGDYRDDGIHMKAAYHSKAYAHFMPLFTKALNHFQGGF